MKLRGILKDLENGQMTWCIKYLLCKNEDLNLEHQHPYKKQGGEHVGGYLVSASDRYMCTHGCANPCTEGHITDTHTHPRTQNNGPNPNICTVKKIKL